MAAKRHKRAVGRGKPGNRNPGRGGTGRFKRCVKAVAKKGGAYDPEAVCAAQERAMYGAKRFAMMGAEGRRRARGNPAIATLTQGPAVAKVYRKLLGGYNAVVKAGKKEAKQDFRDFKAAMAWARLKLFEMATRNPDPYTLSLLYGVDKDSGGVISKIGKKLTAKNITPEVERAYREATAADDAFQEALVKQFGAKAGDYRYETSRHTPAIAALRKKKLHAGARYHQAIEKMRGQPNPEASAAELFEVFHGYPSKEVLEYVQEEHYHEWLAGIGPLIRLRVQNVMGDRIVPLEAPEPTTAKPEQVVQVASSEDGRQLYFVGGDQTLPLDFLMDKFGMTEDDVRDNMLIGTVVQITYRTRKVFEAGGSEERHFFHDLGEEHAEGVLPVLMYKPRTGSMELVGGRYFIAPRDRELGASPGIVG